MGRVFFAAISAVLAFVLSAPAFAADMTAKLIVDGKTFKSSECAVMHSGVLFVPAKQVASKMRLKLHYDPAGKRVKLMKGADYVIFFVGKRQVSANGSRTFVPVAPFVRNGMIYAPLMIFDRYFSSVSSFDGKKRILRVLTNTGKESGIPDVDGGKDMKIDDVDDVKDF